MFRHKSAFGGRVQTRKVENQATEFSTAIIQNDHSRNRGLFLGLDY